MTGLSKAVVLLFQFIYTFQSFVSSLCPFCLPISNIISAKFTFFFQYLVINFCFWGFFYSWSHTCLSIATAVAGLLVNNFCTMTDLPLTNDVYLISGSLALKGLRTGIFHFCLVKIIPSPPFVS